MLLFIRSYLTPCIMLIAFGDILQQTAVEGEVAAMTSTSLVVIKKSAKLYPEKLIVPKAGKVNLSVYYFTRR